MFEIIELYKKEKPTSRVLFKKKHEPLGELIIGETVTVRSPCHETASEKLSLSQDLVQNIFIKISNPRGHSFW